MKIFDRLLELKEYLKDEIEDSGGMGFLLIVVVITLLLWPLILLYFFVIKPLYKGIRMLFDAPKLGLKESYRKQFSKQYKEEHEKKEFEAEKAKDEPLIPDGRIKQFRDLEIWPDAYVVDDVAIYVEEGRTLLYVDEKVEEFDVPEGVENIYHRCFACCGKLRRVGLPTTLKRIGKRAFYDCVSLKEVVVPESVYNVGQEMFMNCTALEHVVLPSQITEIPYRIFCNCKSLQGFSMPVNVKSIEAEAFRRCYAMKHIETNEQLERIMEKAFEDCHSLVEFIMPESVLHFQTGIFNGCHSLEHIHLSSKINDFGGSCCHECWNINQISMLPLSDELRNRFKEWWEDYSEKVDINDSECPYPPSSFWTYRDALYFGIPRLTTVCLIMCFTKATDYTIPSFVTNIKPAAFTICRNLNTLRLSPYIKASDDPWEMNLVSYGFISENWPQVKNIIFDEKLKHTEYAIGMLA